VQGVEAVKRVFAIMTGGLLLVTVTLATLYISVQAAVQLSILARGTAGASTHLLMMELRPVDPNGVASISLTYEDLKPLPSLVPAVTDFTVWSTRSISQIYLRGQAYYDRQLRREPGIVHHLPTRPLLGVVPPQMKSVFGLSLQQGRFISADDVRKGARVAVIGPEIHTQLGGGDVVGEGITLTLKHGSGPETAEYYTVVGVLCHRMPLLATLFRSRNETVRLLLNRMFRVPMDDPTSIATAQAVQREQLAFGNRVLNISVLVPLSSATQELFLPLPPIIYFVVNVPEENRGDLMRDPVSHSYFPRGIAEINDKIRAALLPKIGLDYNLLFLHQGTFADYLRVSVRPALWILGRIVAAGLSLMLLLAVRGLLLPVLLGRPSLWHVRDLYKANARSLAMAIALGAVLGLALNVVGLRLEFAPSLVVSIAGLLIAFAVVRQGQSLKAMTV